MMKLKHVKAVSGAALLTLGSCLAHASMEASRRNLADLSFEELGDIRVTSVSRRSERLSQAAASVFVISSDDIRRSGATSLPEALRLAPNLQVAQVNANQYAITARGFNNAIGNKLLVLIDGRTVYAPFFSGVLWDQQDVMLEDVDRIEVISGPGATLWGTNAVNGVINIVTRSAAKTVGGLASLSGGPREANAAFRYGTALGSTGHARIYAKSSQWQNTRTAAGAQQHDGGQRIQAGFRADWDNEVDAFMLQGNAMQGQTEHRGYFGPFELRPIEVAEHNITGQWTHHHADGANTRVQAYYADSQRDDALLYRPQEGVFDLEAQHGQTSGAHQWVWGGGYRQAKDDLRSGVVFGFVPQRRTLSWTSLFAQDVMALSESVDATLGLRLEHNDYTGMEVLPSTRLAWKLPGDQLLWGAASRAVRAPAGLDRDIRLFPPPQAAYIIAGGPDFRSEVANSYELGWRLQPAQGLNFSISGFYQELDRLHSGQRPPNALVQNMIEGHTSGVEAWGAWQPVRAWRLSLGLTTLSKALRLKPGSPDPEGPRALGNDPDYQWVLRSALNLTETQDIDLSVRHVAALPDPAVPAYTAVDLRYAWRVTTGFEVSVVGRNLFNPTHPEFGPEVSPLAPRSEIERSALLQLQWSL